MAYQGQIFRLPIGTQGLRTDDAQTRVSFDALLEATNINFYKSLAEKAPGTTRWSTSALPGGIAAYSDFWPSDVLQRLCALTSAGALYKYIAPNQALLLGAASTADAQTITFNANKPPCFITGGAESGDNRKLFLFTGTTQVQVVDGDATTRRNITKPAFDWANGSYPTAGCIHAGRLTAWGNANFPHQLYLSAATDHEDFQTPSTLLTFNVFPGEGEGILGCYNFKGRLFIFKFPYGVYYLNDADADSANWSITKLSSTFGVASAFSFVEALDDLYVANAQGSITQMSATLNFGSMTSGNLLRNLRNEQYMRQITARYAYPKRYGLWHEDKKTAYFSYQSAGGTQNDLLLVVDFNDPNTPKVSWYTKDQPSCLALVKDSMGIPQPTYGAADGHIYRLDWPTWDVAGVAYTGSFKTINLDFGTQDPMLADKEKLYDFLEITFEEAGQWDLVVDIYIDNVYSESTNILMSKGRHLDSMSAPASSPSFPLGPTGTSQALGRAPQSYRVPIHGKGRRIAFRCSNSGLRESFRVSEIAIYFRQAGQGQED